MGVLNGNPLQFWKTQKPCPIKPPGAGAPPPPWPSPCTYAFKLIWTSFAICQHESLGMWFYTTTHINWPSTRQQIDDQNVIVVWRSRSYVKMLWPSRSQVLSDKNKLMLRQHGRAAVPPFCVADTRAYGKFIHFSEETIVKSTVIYSLAEREKNGRNQLRNIYVMI